MMLEISFSYENPMKKGVFQLELNLQAKEIYFNMHDEVRRRELTIGSVDESVTRIFAFFKKIQQQYGFVSRKNKVVISAVIHDKSRVVPDDGTAGNLDTDDRKKTHQELWQEILAEYDLETEEGQFQFMCSGSRVELRRSFWQEQKLAAFVGWMISFYADVEGSQFSAFYLDPSEATTMGIRTLEIQLGSSHGTIFLAWIPDVPNRHGNGCFALYSGGGFIGLIFPSIARLINWVVESESTEFSYPVKVQGFQLLAPSNNSNPKVEFYADSRSYLESFLRVILVDFIQHNGLRYQSLGPNFLSFLASGQGTQYHPRLRLKGPQLFP